MGSTLEGLNTFTLTKIKSKTGLWNNGSLLAQGGRVVVGWARWGVRAGTERSLGYHGGVSHYDGYVYEAT